MSLGDNLRAVRIKRGDTQKEAGAKLGISPNTYSNYERGDREPGSAFLTLFAEVYNVTVDSILGVPATRDRDTDALTSQEKKIGCAYGRATPPVQRTVEVALEPFMEPNAAGSMEPSMEASGDLMPDTIDLDERRPKLPLPHSLQRASAGTGVWLDEESFETRYVDADLLPAGVEFGVSVSGDSMEPRYHDGDVLLVAPSKEVHVGDIGVFTLDGDGYVKQRGERVLVSLNKDYEDIPLNESVICNGKVVGKLSPMDLSDDEGACEG